MRNDVGILYCISLDHLGMVDLCYKKQIFYNLREAKVVIEKEVKK